MGYLNQIDILKVEPELSMAIHTLNPSLGEAEAEDHELEVSLAT